MTYHVFRISAQDSLTHLRDFARYQEARRYARTLRAEQAGDPADTIRIVFAEDQAEAESLLTTPRQRQPSEDD